jgi:hypothetical protein
MVDKSEKFRWLVRLGFAARGIVYLLIGLLALTAQRETGPEGAFDLLQDAPLGAPILYLAALGLIGYALFRLASLLFDIENHGSAGKGIAHRIGHGASGVAHLALAWTAFQFAQGTKQSASDAAVQASADSLLSFPFGSLALGLIGIGFLAAAVFQARSAVSAEFTREIAGDAPAAVKTLGRIGYAARAVVFLVIGWSLVRSAWFGSTEEVKSLGQAVGSLADNGVLYTLVAAGLLIFGLFSFLLARYRIIPDLDRTNLSPTLH